MKTLPQKSTQTKKSSTAKTSGKSKTTAKKPAPKKPKKSEIKAREAIAGAAMLLIGIVLLVFAFQPPLTGTVGPAVKLVFVGTFGAFTYILPMVLIALGLVMIFKKKIGIKWLQVIIWSVFALCAVLFFHIFFLKSIYAKDAIVDIDVLQMTLKDYLLRSYDYARETNGFSSGLIGGLLSYRLLKNFGVFGIVFVPLAYILIVLIVKNRDLISKAMKSAKLRMDERIKEKQAQLTPLEKIGSEAPQSAPVRRKIPDSALPASKTTTSSSKELHVLKDKKQDLYVEDIKNIPDNFADDGELNTDFLLRNNKQPLSSGGHHKYTVDENQWNSALEEEKSKEYTKSTSAKHGNQDGKPTIQINIADTDDYKSKSANSQPKHSGEYKFPPLDLIAFSNNKLDETLRTQCHTNAMILEETLSSFRIEAKVINITCGPTVTRYELRPAPGIRVAKINNLSRDLAMALAATSVRIEAPIPNKNAVVIEVPNKTRSLVGLRDILEGSKFRTSKSALTICVGKDITGRNIVADLAKMPHMLVAGATGSGKSVFINSLILSLIYKSSPKDVRFIMVDPKKVELNVYNGIPHLLIPVVTKASLAASALNWAVKEMLKRYDIFAENGVRNLESYNKLAESKSNNLEHFPRIVIIVDELADLMQVASAEVEDAIYRLAQLARAAGMHLVIATQRPDVKVITGTIKANIPCRVAFSVNQLVDSRTIIDGSGAEHLLGNGDMLFKFGGKPMRLQGAFVADKEVEKVCEYLKAEGVVYDDNVIEDVKKIEKQSQGSPGGMSDSENDFDDLLPDALKVIYDNEKASTSMVQRKLRVGYNRAARIIDDLERLGVLGPPDGSKPREIMVTYGTAMQIVNGENDG